jgi:hypothetical protein
MIPLVQTKFSDTEKGIHGNCFGTCVASLLELDPATVPPFEDLPDGKWFPPFWELLKNNGCRFGGTRHMRQRILDGEGWPDDIGPGVDGYYIVGGGSPRGFTRGHAVIYRAGEMVMDPHPSGAGLTGIWDIYMIERGEQ